VNSSAPEESAIPATQWAPVALKDKRQVMVHKSPQRKLKIEQLETCRFLAGLELLNL
jgi:hypothetical protein